MRDFQDYYPNDKYTDFDHKYACWSVNHNGWRKAKKKWRKIGKKRMKAYVIKEIEEFNNENNTK